MGSGLFWLTLGIIFAFGGVLPHWLTGLLVLFLVALDGCGQVRRGSAETDAAEQAEHARRLGNRIFIPVLVIPIVTFAFALVFRGSGYGRESRRAGRARLRRSGGDGRVPETHRQRRARR